VGTLGTLGQHEVAFGFCESTGVVTSKGDKIVGCDMGGGGSVFVVMYRCEGSSAC